LRRKVLRVCVESFVRVCLVAAELFKDKVVHSQTREVDIDQKAVITVSLCSSWVHPSK